MRLSWILQQRDFDICLMLEWKERGGPAVTPPEHKDFGSRLIERALSSQDGAAAFRFEPQGLTCTLELAL